MILQVAKPEVRNEIIYQNEKAILKLKEFGLTYEDIETSAILAIKEFNNLSKYAYTMDKNTKFFYSIIKHFRERMCLRGWSVEDKYNLNRTLPSSRNRAFVFSSGDKNVCNNDITPMTKNRKGEVSLATVEMNNVIQLTMLKELFPGEKIFTEKYDIGELQHWFILFNKNKNKVWIEISLPEGIDKKTNKICKWSERILLPIIEYKENLIDINKNLSDDNKLLSSYNKEEELNITRK